MSWTLFLSSWKHSLANLQQRLTRRNRRRGRRDKPMFPKARLELEQLEIRWLMSAGITEFGIPTASSSPQGMVSGPDGNLWFVESAKGKIAKITTSGTITEYSTGITAGATPWDITVGPDGNLWFTEKGKDQVAKATTTGTITEYALTASAAPLGITGGPDGNLWVAESGLNNVPLPEMIAALAA
jgi:streptogramin lyase